MKRLLFGAAVGLAAASVGASGPWQGAEIPTAAAIELSSLQRNADYVSFRERHDVPNGRIDPETLRPVREVLVKRVLDCGKRRIATLSRAVFSEGDALIDYRAVHPRHAEWKRMAKDDPVFKLVCGQS